MTPPRKLLAVWACTVGMMAPSATIAGASGPITGAGNAPPASLPVSGTPVTPTTSAASASPSTFPEAPPVPTLDEASGLRTQKAAGQPPAVANDAADLIAEHPWSIGAIAGSSFQINGLNYNEGVGVRAGRTVALPWLKHFYLGGIFAAHAGASKTMHWGATVFSRAGDQHYSSHPLFIAADAGYSFSLSIGSLETVFTPCLSAGLMTIGMDTNGVYGRSSSTNNYAIFGLGFSYGAILGRHLFAGAHYRIYNTGDTSFVFGDLQNGTYEHGFYISVFYHALYLELAYRI